MAHQLFLARSKTRGTTRRCCRVRATIILAFTLGMLAIDDIGSPSAAEPNAPSNASTSSSRNDTSDALPSGAIQRFGSDRFRVAGSTRSLCFSPSGDRLYALAGGKVAVLDPATGRRIDDVRMNPGKGQVSRMVASPDGELIAFVVIDFSSNSQPLPAKIVVVSHGSSRRQILPAGNVEDRTRAIGFCGDNKILFDVSEYDGFRFWDLETGRTIEVPTMKNDKVICAAISPDGNSVVAGGWVRSYLWNWRTDDAILEIPDFHERPVHAVFSHDGQRFVMVHATKSDPPRIRVFDRKSAKELWSIPPDGKLTRPEAGFAFTPDDRQIAIPFLTGDVLEIWDVEQQRCVDKFPTTLLTGVCISRDGRWLAGCGLRSQIDIWDLHEKKQMNSLVGHSGQIEQITFTSDDRQMISAASDATIRIWETASGRQLNRLDYMGVNGPPLNHFSSLAVSSDGKQVAATALDGTIATFDSETGTRRLKWSGHGKNSGLGSFAKFTDGDTRLLTWGSDGRLRSWISASGDLVSTVEIKAAKDHPLMRGQITTDSKILIAQGEEDLLEFDLAGGGEPVPLQFELPVEDFALSPDGEWLATVQLIRANPQLNPPRPQFSVTLWFRENLVMGYRSVPCDQIRCVTFSNDSRLLAYVVNSDSIAIVDVMRGAIVASIPNGQRCNLLRFSNDGRKLAAGNSDHTILLWDIEKFKLAANRNLAD